MRATGMAALLDRIATLRAETLRPTPTDKEMRQLSVGRIESIWADISAVLAGEKRAEVETLDRWLARVDKAMEDGGDVAKLVDQGRRLLDIRRELISLDVETSVQPQPAASFPSIVDQSVMDDEMMDRLRQERPSF